MVNIQEQINQKQADILSAKAYLYETDWEVIKATELKYTLSEEISNKRIRNNIYYSIYCWSYYTKIKQSDN